MHILVSTVLDPYFNLATEEFLLKNVSDNVIFLYRNRPCVVVGKHQNAMAEINYRFVQENKIPVIRRISGGGTVYHDEGNINFTFLQNGEEGKLVNFKAFIAPVAEFLKTLGVPAEIGSRNDILVNGLKVSGNAEHIYKKRTLHHGTLLFSSTLTDLRNSLHIEGERYFDKAVKSVRSKVANIQESVPELKETSVFFEKLTDFLTRYFQASPLVLQEEALAQIKSAAETKYTDWAWNFGYSPDYVFRNSIDSGSANLLIEMRVEKGIIQTAAVNGNIDQTILAELQNSLVNTPHSVQQLAKNESIIKLESRLNAQGSEILWAFF